MEAIEFLKEAQRMCKKHHCVECPVGKYINHSEDKLGEIVSEVEQWSKEHPIVTNAHKFEEVFGFLPDGDVIFSKDYFINAVKGPVLKWDEPYKEPEHDG